jgi:hypothetical protein
VPVACILGFMEQICRQPPFTRRRARNPPKFPCSGK